MSAVICHEFSLQALCDFENSDDSIPELASLTYSSLVVNGRILCEIMFGNAEKVMEELNLCH